MGGLLKVSGTYLTEPFTVLQFLLDRLKIVKSLPKIVLNHTPIYRDKVDQTFFMRYYSGLFLHHTKRLSILKSD